MLKTRCVQCWKTLCVPYWKHSNSVSSLLGETWPLSTRLNELRRDIKILADNLYRHTRIKKHPYRWRYQSFLLIKLGLLLVQTHHFTFVQVETILSLCNSKGVWTKHQPCLDQTQRRYCPNSHSMPRTQRRQWKIAFTINTDYGRRGIKKWHQKLVVFCLAGVRNTRENSRFSRKRERKMRFSVVETTNRQERSAE